LLDDPDDLFSGEAGWISISWSRAGTPTQKNKAASTLQWLGKTRIGIDGVLSAA